MIIKVNVSELEDTETINFYLNDQLNLIQLDGKLMPILQRIYTMYGFERELTARKEYIEKHSKAIEYLAGQEEESIKRMVETAQKYSPVVKSFTYRNKYTGQEVTIRCKPHQTERILESRLKDRFLLDKELNLLNWELIGSSYCSL